MVSSPSLDFRSSKPILDTWKRAIEPRPTRIPKRKNIDGLHLSIQTISNKTYVALFRQKSSNPALRFYQTWDRSSQSILTHAPKAKISDVLLQSSLRISSWGCTCPHSSNISSLNEQALRDGYLPDNAQFFGDNRVPLFVLCQPSLINRKLYPHGLTSMLEEALAQKDLTQQYLQWRNTEIEMRRPGGPLIFTRQGLTSNKPAEQANFILPTILLDSAYIN